MTPEDKIIDFAKHRKAPQEPSSPPPKAEDMEYDSSVQTSDTEDSGSQRGGIPHVLDLPDGLRPRIVKQYMTAAAVGMLTLVLVIYFREPGYLIGFLLSGLLVYNGVSASLDYAEGKIVEMAVLCASVNAYESKTAKLSNGMQRTSKVVFRTVSEAADDIPEYFEFQVPGSVEGKIFPNYAYIIYFDPTRPKELLGFMAI